MEIPVFDFRKDIQNVLVTPQIRARFLKMEIGQYNEGHTHDLGQEIFLILQGQAEFVIDGKKAILGPGQLCYARTDEWHSVENVGDEEVIMYLSVTPHVQPTHTYYNKDGSRKPPQFYPNTAYDRPMDATPTADVLAACLAGTEHFANAVQAFQATMQTEGETMKAALAAEDEAAVIAARNAMWEKLRAVYSSLAAFSTDWNELGSHTADSKYNG